MSNSNPITVKNIIDELNRYYSIKEKKYETEALRDPIYQNYLEEDLKKLVGYYNEKCFKLTTLDKRIARISVDNEQDQQFKSSIQQLFQRALDQYATVLQDAIKYHHDQVEYIYTKFFSDVSYVFFAKNPTNVFEHLLNLNDDIIRSTSYYTHANDFNSALRNLRNNLTLEMLNETNKEYSQQVCKPYVEVIKETQHMLKTFNVNNDHSKTALEKRSQALSQFQYNCGVNRGKNFAKAVGAIVISCIKSVIGMAITCGIGILLLPDMVRSGPEDMGINRFSTFARYLTFQPTATERMAQQVVDAVHARKLYGGS